VPHDVVEPKTGSNLIEMCRCVEYYCVFVNTPCFEILLLPFILEGGQALLFFLCSLIGAYFFYAS
jgi:hypothetical protein